MDILYSRDFENVDEIVEVEIMDEYNKSFKQAYEAVYDEDCDIRQVKDNYYTSYFGRHNSEDMFELLQSKYKEYSNKKDKT